jgi:hypothetical protein
MKSIEKTAEDIPEVLDGEDHDENDDGEEEGVPDVVGIGGTSLTLRVSSALIRNSQVMLRRRRRRRSPRRKRLQPWSRQIRHG